MTEVGLAALLGSRLCHDLANPLGAIGNGVELLAMTQPASPELDLLTDAVKGAQARLNLFRLAFGAAAPDQVVSPQQMTAALAGVEARLELTADLPATLPRPQARRLMLALLCVESALAWGGQVALTAGAVAARAARLRLDPGLWDALARGRAPADPASAQVQFAMLAASGPGSGAATHTTLMLSL